jgi:diguanylate cyclase (GGDEF)-like protein/PAS domain S-box-containing protein
MAYQFHPYFVVLTISALATLGVALLTRRRSAPGSAALGGLLFAMFLWCITYAITWIVIPLEDKVFWLKIMYIGVVLVPTLFLVFTLQITHRERWLTFRTLVLLSIEPVVILAVMWSATHLLFVSVEPVIRDGLVVMQVQRGIVFRINVFYSYAVILFSFYILAVSYRHANSIFRKQYLLILAGSVIPLIFNLHTQTKNLALRDLDLAPISFAISGIVYAYAIFRHQFMELIPVARSRLIENMSDGVLVIDSQGRIIDINPAMKNFLDGEPASFIGRNVSEALKSWGENAEEPLNGLETRTELRLPDKPSRYLDLRVTPLYDDDRRLTGRLIVFRDVTDRKEVERDLRYAMDRLQTQLIEIGVLQNQLREQAIRDPLTNLFNRRYLEETLDRELARAARELYPLCILLMDLDHFKEVNDTYGHEAGDVVLRTLAEVVTRQSRQGDFVCRYGGEEFVLVMPNIGIETAKGRALELQQNINSINIPFGRFRLTTTISMGIAWYPAHGDTKEELLRAADRALYAAKNGGRNRVFIYRDLEMKQI